MRRARLSTCQPATTTSGHRWIIKPATCIRHSPSGHKQQFKWQRSQLAQFSQLIPAAPNGQQEDNNLQTGPIILPIKLTSKLSLLGHKAANLSSPLSSAQRPPLVEFALEGRRCVTGFIEELCGKFILSSGLCFLMPTCPLSWPSLAQWSSQLCLLCGHSAGCLARLCHELACLCQKLVTIGWSWRLASFMRATSWGAI